VAVKFAAFVQQLFHRPDRGQDSVLLAAHPANPASNRNSLSMVSLSRMWPKRGGPVEARKSARGI
jgi:hypothetical protein